MSNVNANVYIRPTPAKVAALVASHGMEAAVGRWHWLDDRTLGSLAQTGRAARGEVLQGASKRRLYSELDAAVCVEASYILGSATRGERASGVGHNVTQGLFPRRGLPYVCISPAERGRAASIGNLAKAGNVEAIAEREQRHAHEIAVGQVLRAALALVPSQPSTRRYRLPPVDDALRVALAGQDLAAVAAVFPDLAVVDVVDVAATATAEEAAPVPVSDPTPPTEVPAVSEPIPHFHRRAPDDSILRFDHADSQDLVVLAAHYGISPPALYAHWRRLNLSGRGRMNGFGAAQRPVEAEIVEPAPQQESAHADVPAEAVAREPVAPAEMLDPYGALSPEEAVAVVAGIEAIAPLGLHHLALAVRLAAETGLSKDEAISWVRADIHAVAATRVIPPAEDVIDKIAIVNAAIADEVFRTLMLADDVMSTRQ